MLSLKEIMMKKKSKTSAPIIRRARLPKGSTAVRCDKGDERRLSYGGAM